MSFLYISRFSIASDESSHRKREGVSSHRSFVQRRPAARMYRKICAATSLILIAVLFINSVNSLKCYSCVSINSGDCFTNPAQRTFITECNPSSMRKRMVDVSGMSALIDNLMEELDSIDLKWECVKIVSKPIGQLTTVRPCAPIKLPCPDEPDTLCYRCKKQLCNSAESASLIMGMFAVLGVYSVK
uniref:Protein quiver n=1 Tax=Trichogramma kaykai TaxID=54128 RepID=A0ABD2WXV5_9HYME